MDSNAHKVLGLINYFQWVRSESCPLGLEFLVKTLSKIQENVAEIQSTGQKSLGFFKSTR